MTRQACVAERRTMGMGMVTWAAGVFLSGLGWCPVLEAHVAGTVYVGPDGNDGWSGTLPAANQERTDGPFQTLGRARDAIRQMKKDTAAAPLVLVRGGTYYLSEPLILTPDDSGTKDHPVRYAAYPGERPILSGGRPVSGWHQGDGNLWTSQIGVQKAQTWSAQQLFVDGFVDPTGKLLYFDAQTLHAWPQSPDKVLHIFMYEGGLCSNTLASIASIDEGQSLLTTAKRLVDSRADAGARFFVDNVREALDSPGEWYLDRATGLLTYWPVHEEQRSGG